MSRGTASWSCLHHALPLIALVFALLSSHRSTHALELQQLALKSSFKFKEFRKIAAFAASSTLFFSSLGVQPSHAFDNALHLSEAISKTPKTPGPKPVLGKTYGIDADSHLMICGKPSPNCFSTSADTLFEDERADEHAVPLWRYKGVSRQAAFEEIGEVLQKYEVGHDNIDGGGFQIAKVDKDKKYYYVVFESSRRGFRDDVEILVDEASTGTVQH